MLLHEGEQRELRAEGGGPHIAQLLGYQRIGHVHAHESSHISVEAVHLVAAEQLLDGGSLRQHHGLLQACDVVGRGHVVHHQFAVDLLALFECLWEARYGVGKRGFCQVIGANDIGGLLQSLACDLIEQLCLCAQYSDDEYECGEDPFHVCLWFDVIFSGAKVRIKMRTAAWRATFSAVM